MQIAARGDPTTLYGNTDGALAWCFRGSHPWHYKWIWWVGSPRIVAYSKGLVDPAVKASSSLMMKGWRSFLEINTHRIGNCLDNCEEPKTVSMIRPPWMLLQSSPCGARTIASSTVVLLPAMRIQFFRAVESASQALHKLSQWGPWVSRQGKSSHNKFPTDLFVCLFVCLGKMPYKFACFAVLIVAYAQCKT